MKKFLEFLLDFFKDKNEGNSYKRITGFICMVVAIILAFMNKETNNIALFLSVALGEGIATLFEKKE